MKRIRNQLRIHWNWLRKEDDYNIVGDFIGYWMRQVASKHNCILNEDSAKVIEDYDKGKITFAVMCEKASKMPGVQEFVKEARKRLDLEDK